MKVMWCWRCKQNVPMLDEDEYHAIYALYGESFHRAQKQAREQQTMPNAQRLTLHELFEPVRKEYGRMTGMGDCHHNAICITAFRPMVLRTVVVESHYALLALAFVQLVVK